MKTLALLISSLVFVAAGAAAEPTVVEMKSLGYKPKAVTIAVGQAVVWKNTAYTEHSAVSDNPAMAFDTGMVAPGKESTAITFTKPGVYNYHCALHGKSMSGVLTVKADKK